MRSLWKPAIVLVAAPTVIMVAISVVDVGLRDFVFSFGIAPPSALTDTQIALVMSLGLVAAILLGLTGRWFGRRVPLPTSYPPLRGVAVVWLGVLGLVAILWTLWFVLELLPRDVDLRTFFGIWTAAPVWGLALTVVMVGVALLLGRGQRVAAAIVAVLGGYGSVAAGAAASHLAPLEWLKYPVTGTHIFALFAHVLAGATVFALAYVYAHHPKRVPAVTVEREAAAR